MAQFHVHPDGLVHIRTANSIYIDTLTNFVLDCSAALPAIPPGAIQVLYDDNGGVLQFFDVKNNQIGVGQKDLWQFADEAITAVSTLLAAQANRTLPSTLATKPVLEIETRRKPNGNTTVAS